MAYFPSILWTFQTAVCLSERLVVNGLLFCRVEQDIIYRVLSAVLTLGNTTFRETEVARVDILLFLQLIVVGVDGQVASGEAVEISEPYIITKAAEMLGTPLCNHDFIDDNICVFVLVACW